MPKGVLVYLSFHEPRRLRLPAASVSEGDSLQSWIIDQQSSEQFFKTWLEEICQPYNRGLRQMISEGARFMVNVSGPLLESLTLSRSRTALSFLSLLRQSRVTFVCSEAKHSLSCYLDIQEFVRQTKRSYDLAKQVGISSSVAVAPQMSLSSDIYYALASLPFSFVIADGCQDSLGGRSSAFFRRNGWGPFIITRNSELSLRIISMLNAPPEPLFDLRAAEIVQQVAEVEGDYVLLGWQVPSPASRETVEGGLQFLERLCGEMLRGGMEFIDVRKLTSKDRLFSTNIPLPAMPAVSAEHGSISYFLGHPAQQMIFGLMLQAYSVAQLSRNEQVIDKVLDLAQWDLLSLVHRLLMSNGYCQEPSYLTAEQLTQLGGNGVVDEIQRVIENFIVSVSELYL